MLLQRAVGGERRHAAGVRDLAVVHHRHRVAELAGEGEEVMVKVVSIDRTGKIRLSRKEALAERAQQGAGEPPKTGDQPKAKA